MVGLIDRCIIFFVSYAHEYVHSWCYLWLMDLALMVMCGILCIGVLLLLHPLIHYFNVEMNTLFASVIDRHSNMIFFVDLELS